MAMKQPTTFVGRDWNSPPSKQFTRMFGSLKKRPKPSAGAPVTMTLVATPDSVKNDPRKLTGGGSI